MTAGNGKDLGIEAAIAEGARLDRALDEAQSPMATLVAAYKHAPHSMVRNFINGKVLEMLLTDLPRLSSMLTGGPVADAAELPSVAAAFAAIIEQGPPDGQTNEDWGLTDDVIALGQSLADDIDFAVQSLLGADEYFLRMPLYDLLTAHAKLVKALAEIRLSDEQKTIIAEKKAAAEASNDETISEPTV